MIRIAALAALLLATPAAAKTIAVEAGPDAQQRLQSALIEAAPGDVVAIGAGRFELTDGLSLDVDRVTVRGAGADRTVLSFKGQLGAGEGLLVTSDDVVLRGFAVEDTKGDGIKSKGADRIVYKDIRVEWTGGPKASNGSYGVYPVQSKWILIDGVTVKGASDAGIYVGQSEQIVVRNSTASGNVAGIEIENSNFADVHDNLATHNTGGILVFDLPALPREGGGDVRVFRNKVIDNDTANFAPSGNIVAIVPKGTGVLVMANERVQVFDNDLSGNGTSNVMIIAYPLEFKDTRYEPRPRSISVSRNRHGAAGFAPMLPGGPLLTKAFGGTLPPILVDGTAEASAIHIDESVPVASLGLAKPGAIETARPGLATLTGAEVKLDRVVLPPAMESAAK
jgi:parallel beta-helix repeat protein